MLAPSLAKKLAQMACMQIEIIFAITVFLVAKDAATIIHVLNVHLGTTWLKTHRNAYRLHALKGTTYLEVAV